MSHMTFWKVIFSDVYKNDDWLTFNLQEPQNVKSEIGSRKKVASIVVVYVLGLVLCGLESERPFLLLRATRRDNRKVEARESHPNWSSYVGLPRY